MMRKKSMATALDEYVDWLKWVKGRSDNTIRGYRHDLEQITEGLTQVDELTLAYMRAHLAATQHLSAATRQRRVASAKSFVRWASKQGYSRQAAGIERLVTPKSAKSMARPHSVEDAMSLCDTLRARALPSQMEANSWCLLELLYGLGLRIEEAVGINLQDIDVGGMKLRILGKGDKERALPFGPNQLAPIMILMLVRRPKNPDDPALFIGDKGGRLNQRQARRFYDEACEVAGVEKLHPHALRHSCATHMLEGGADIRFVAEQLGHSSLATTQRYLHLTAKRLMNVVNDCHPRAGEAA